MIGWEIRPGTVDHGGTACANTRFPIHQGLPLLGLPR